MKSLKVLSADYVKDRLLIVSELSDEVGFHIGDVLRCDDIELTVAGPVFVVAEQRDKHYFFEGRTQSSIETLPGKVFYIKEQ